MQKQETPIDGLFVIEPQVYGDDRGFFYESYNEDKMKALGIDHPWKQDSHSASVKGVLRGLHFQLPPKPMAKLVRCTRGRVWDVVVDLRKDSPTYLQWFGVELSAENKKMLYVPAGFAHGFHALEDCEFVYKVSETFDGELDGNVRYDDPAFDIDWKLEGEPELSARDKAAPGLGQLDLPF
jgi:dTDP-4-dehydrorhamnose 3,5-epimerase